MSVREGTRRKKISVLHMLGTWEGKIEGCNCPSCKEFDAGEKSLGAGLKSPTKTPKISKQPAKKVSIKVKTTKLSTLGDESVHQDENLSEIPTLLKSARDTVGPEGVEMGSMCEDEDGPSGNITQGLEVVQSEGAVAPKVKKEVRFVREDWQKDIDEVTDGESLDWGSEGDGMRSLKRSYDESVAKTGERQKNIREEAMINIMNPVSIKQEPEEYFSDEEEIMKSNRLSGEAGKSDWPKMAKRARMVTSEIENVYAKPRMVFTGKGVVRKFEPGADKTPKSKRGRKPNKVLSPVKIKQEPKDPEETNKERDMDQLQRALSEAAAGISDVGEFIDELQEMEGKVGPKDDKKKKKQKWFKKVENEIDKYVECNICFKLLKESSMKQHYKTHTGEKPHTCDECDARFTRKGDVERHKRLVHKNQKPFKCKKCNKEFSDRKNLKSHLINHDKAIYYACDTCGFKFGKREYYENHIRYIHPLPNGQMPVFPEGDEDLASKQLRELEMEESKEQENDRERAGANENLQLEDIDEDEDEEDEDKAMEITVTEGEESNAFLGNRIKREPNSSNHEGFNTKRVDGEGDIIKDTDTGVVMQGSQVGTEVKVSKGTLSFTQTLPDTDAQDEELVNKVIAAAVSQATNTLENMKSIVGGNLSRNEFDMDDDEEEEEDEEDEDDIIEGAEAIEDMLDSSNYDLLPIPAVQKADEQQTEIHINASVGGQKKKFIIQVPPGNNFNVQTNEGMEMIINMVNQLCPGKGELDGPIEVVMHNPGSRLVGLE